MGAAGIVGLGCPMTVDVWSRDGDGGKELIPKRLRGSARRFNRMAMKGTNGMRAGGDEDDEPEGTPRGKTKERKERRAGATAKAKAKADPTRDTRSGALPKTLPKLLGPPLTNKEREDAKTYAPKGPAPDMVKICFDHASWRGCADTCPHQHLHKFLDWARLHAAVRLALVARHGCRGHHPKALTEPAAT